MQYIKKTCPITRRNSKLLRHQNVFILLDGIAFRCVCTKSSCAVCTVWYNRVQCITNTVMGAYGSKEAKVSNKSNIRISLSPSFRASP
jgi:hypothetical protein